MEKYVYQMFILGLGNHIDALQKGLGGVIFFTKDIQSNEQLEQEIKSINEHSILPPFISIDQEGGKVERTENIRPKRLSAKEAYKHGQLIKQSDEIAQELASWGFNLNFAPCIDVNTNPNNPIIGERAFSNNPDEVIQGGEIFIKSMRKYGIIPCIKHFPGHGDADKDSHLTLPVINLTIDEMEKTHIKPFKHFADNIEMIMVAHLHCTCFDQQTTPTSLSKNAISYLRNNMQYNGVLISDDMVMKGVQEYGSLEACIKGIDAGIDMFIFRDSNNETLAMINKLVEIAQKDKNLQDKIMASYKRISALKSRL